MALASMSGKEAKMGDFMMQKWPCILTRILDRNQVKNVIFVRKSSYDAVLTSFKQRIHRSAKTDDVSASQKLPFLLIKITLLELFHLALT